MIRRGWLLAGCLTLLSALPAAAGPRVTLKLERASLHQIFLQLRSRTGLQFRSQDGTGEDAYKEPAGAKQVKVEWKDETLGRVIREICAAFDLSAQSMGDGGYWFRPGSLPKRSEVLSGGVAFSLGGISQSESATVTPGTEQPRVQRYTYLRLVCRAEEGDGDLIGALTKFSVTDEAGKVQEVPKAVIRLDSSYGLPDERMRSIGLNWQGEHPKRLAHVDGELELFDRVEEHRLVVAVPAKTLPVEQQLGAAKISVKKLTTEGRRTECRFTVEWPSNVEVPLNGPGMLRTLLRLENGKTERVWLSSFVQPETPLTRSVQCEFTAEFSSPVASMEILVPTRQSSGKKVSFRIENAVMPFGRSLQLRLAPLNLKVRPTIAGSAGGRRGVPEPFYSRDGGALRVPTPGIREEDAGVEVQVGLSRQAQDGTWSPIRWSQYAATSEPLRLEKLAPGRYRIRVTYWQRRTNQPLKHMSIPDRTAEVVIRKGAEAHF